MANRFEKYLEQAPQGGWIEDPYKSSAEARAAEDQRLQRAADERARLAEDRANRAEGRLDEKADSDRVAREARGGIETTEGERKAAFLATRVAGGLRDLAAVGNIGAPGLMEATLGQTMVGNYTTDEARQRAFNAQREIIDAALTLGTGAAYTAEQIDAYRKSYFPQPGDQPQTIEDKRRRVQTMLAAARLQAGGASGLIDQALKGSEFMPPATDGQAPAMSQEQAYQPGVVTPVPIPPSAYAEGGGPEAPQQNYNDSYLSQFLSGTNEGIAGTLGLPVDVATSALNLIPQGINAIANTNLGQIENPILGGNWWEDRLSDAGAIGAESTATGAPFVRRVGQSVGSAAIPAAGAMSAPTKAIAALLSGGAGGVGAATAQQAFPGNPVAEMAGEAVGTLGAGAGAFGLARNSARKAAEAAVPTVPQLKQQASDLYSQAESRGVVAGPNVTSNLAGRVRQIARDEEVITPENRPVPGYDQISRTATLVDDYAGKDMNARQIGNVRKTVADTVRSSDGNERRIANLLLDAFDEETLPLAPEFSDARRTASKYLQAERVHLARELGDNAATAPSTALRSKFRQLGERVIKGYESFNPAVQNAINTVSKGDLRSNIARNLGTFALTRNPASFIPSLTAGSGAGMLTGDPLLGTVLGLGASGMGMAARRLSDKWTDRSAEIAELLARNGGELVIPPLVDNETTRQIAALLATQSGQYVEP